MEREIDKLNEVMSTPSSGERSRDDLAGSRSSELDRESGEVVTASTHAGRLSRPQDLDKFWMPFTANRDFRKQPRLITAAEGMYYFTANGDGILDGTAGLWCVNAGHGRREIVQAVHEQMMELDYAPSFLQLGHPLAFSAANKVAELTPPGLDRIFFTNSGSEAIDTALKMAICYHHCRGDTQRFRFIGRERSYHGVNFGGMSVGGIANNRAKFHANLMPGVQHLRATYDYEKQRFSRGEPEWGGELADELEQLVDVHGAHTIAAVIVEPVAGSTGVLVPPRGYLRRLERIARTHGILLILDEVITGFGRLGTPFSAQYFGVSADLIVMGKGINNASIPMAAVAAKNEIYQTIVDAAPANTPEFFHGYTFSAHPAACAASLAAQEIYAREGLFQKAGAMAGYFEEAIHSLEGIKGIKDIRNIGLLGAIEFESNRSANEEMALEIHYRCFARGLLVRHTGSSVTLSPPFIVKEAEVDLMIDTIAAVLKTF
ncbi:beta-alanine--pyruvate transaminase [Paraburkholderia megapolitana]|uniref:Beta-alanine--pyruvate transaminase n=2 Tax=Paraburkholderia megapolitana TaxID=420953 RepID=A0A1I3TUG0_9BURK|nr:beta-alanine--pyruvate transaminase [Paraburkholderia megapolitana]